MTTERTPELAAVDEEAARQGQIDEEDASSTDKVADRARVRQEADDKLGVGERPAHKRE